MKDECSQYGAEYEALVIKQVLASNKSSMQNETVSHVFDHPTLI